MPTKKMIRAMEQGMGRMLELPEAVYNKALEYDLIQDKPSRRFAILPNGAVDKYESYLFCTATNTYENLFKVIPQNKDEDGFFPAIKKERAAKILVFLRG